MAELIALRNVIKNGWVQVETKPVSHKILAAEQKVSRFIAGEADEEMVRQSLDRLDADQKTQVIRQFVYLGVRQGKEQKALLLNTYETNEKERNLNFILMALFFEKQEAFEKSLGMVAQVTEAELREDMVRIIKQNQQFRLAN
jgi:hypothetical protein